MTTKLENFIVDVLNAPTSEEMRVIVANELANIRTFIRDCDSRYKPSLVAKIMFLHMRGENTAWANVEIANLMAHDRPSYKRIGYLAAMNTFEANSELTVLITHTLEKDLSNSNPLVQMLPLTLLAQMGTADMFRELSTEIMKLIEAPQVYIQKRCVAAMYKAVLTVPELGETFRPLVHKLLSSPNHCVVNATIDLAMALIHNDPNLPSQWAQFSVPFIKIVKTLYETRPIREFEFSIFNDPFLLIKILKMLCALCSKSDDLDDVLSTIVTGVDVKRNTGRSILFQTIQTINVCAKKPSLRSLAYNQIGRLFAFKEPNVLYSALSSFSRVLYGAGSIDRTSADSVVLQRYKSQVVHCLDHRDPSIRRRALDVVAALVDSTNVETLIPEVMGYLHMADSDFRSELVAKVFQSVQRFAPNPKWNFETVMKLIIESGNYVGTDVITAFCKLIGTNEEIRQFAVKQLSEELPNNSDNQPLVQVAAWTIGEYGNSLEEWETMKRLLSMPQTKNETKGYILIAFAKLGCRLGKNQEAVDVITELASSNDLELQQRAGELIRILTKSSFRDALLAPIEFEHTNISIQSQNDEADLLGLDSTTEAKPQQKDVIQDILGAPAAAAEETPKKEVKEPQQSFKPPPGAVEALRTHDYVIYFEIQRNSNNPNQLAIRSSVYGLGTIPLNKFTVQYGLPVGWALQLQKPSGNVLEPNGANPIVQILLLVNRGQAPLQMRTQITYLYRSQPLKDMGAINPNVFK